MSGEFLTLLGTSPFGHRIDSVCPYSNGLFFGGEGGKIWQYRGVDDDYEPYQPIRTLCSDNRNNPKRVAVEAANVAMMAIPDESEDALYFIDRNNQLLMINLQAEPEELLSDYVIGPFHHDEITGMDTCLRKELVVTCSKTSIMLWNYAERKFLMAFKVSIGEEASDVAFHPSGFHILACVGDKLVILNVLAKSIKEDDHSLTIKHCKKVRFSNGGHLFAVGVSCYTYIYNFYTLECPPYFQCKGHIGKIGCIDWFEDDSGFTDSCDKGYVFFYDL